MRRFWGGSAREDLAPHAFWKKELDRAALRVWQANAGLRWLPLIEQIERSFVPWVYGIVEFVRDKRKKAGHIKPGQ